jgi:hypothetical protein
VVVDRRCVEIPRCGELSDLGTPPREYVVTLSFDEPRQFTKYVDGLSPPVDRSVQPAVERSATSLSI